MKGGTGISSFPSGPVMVIVWASDSRASGPPRGIWRGDGLKYFVLFGGGGGETASVTVGGMVRRFMPTFEAHRGVVENLRMH